MHVNIQVIRFVVLLVAAVTFNRTVAQENEEQKRMMRGLHFLAGDWNVEAESRLSLNGPWEKTKGVAKFVISLDSTLIEENYKGSRQGNPFLSKTFLAVNNLALDYQRTFIDSPHGVMMHFEGKRNGDTITFDKEFTYPNGNAIMLRVVYVILSNNQFRVETMRKPRDTGNWDTTSHLMYTRSR
jgi:hypothetical protein